MRQGNDIGSQYRSAIYTLTPEQYAQAIESKQRYQQAINSEGAHKEITTEIQPAGPFYFAEDYHQQYLFKTLKVIVDLVALVSVFHRQTNTSRK